MVINMLAKAWESKKHLAWTDALHAFHAIGDRCHALGILFSTKSTLTSNLEQHHR